MTFIGIRNSNKSTYGGRSQDSNLKRAGSAVYLFLKENKYDASQLQNLDEDDLVAAVKIWVDKTPEINSAGLENGLQILQSQGSLASYVQNYLVDTGQLSPPKSHRPSRIKNPAYQ
jgi:hypothetical protein|tara:strand:+ start:952 stop:1299 length:348 start_codon:yes stop_codon:yes gene_type:complete